MLLFIGRSNDFFGQYAWDKNVPFSATTLSAAEQARLQHKRTALGRWFEHALQSGVCAATPCEDDCFGKAVALLFRHEVREACAVLRDGGYDRLAVLAAQISIRSEWGEA